MRGLREQKTREPTFLMLQPAVLQVVLNAALKLLWAVVGDQDGNKGIQGIKSFLEKEESLRDKSSE